MGARKPLIAFNLNLATDDLEIAQQIAETIRESSGGMPAVQAMGVLVAVPEPPAGPGQHEPRRLGADRHPDRRP